MGIFSGGTDTSTSTFKPVQSQEIGSLLSGAQDQFDRGFFDPSVFGQSGVAGFTPQQLQALQQQQENAQSFSQFTPQASAGIQQLLSGQVNPIYEQQAQGQADFLQRNFERNVLPSIGQGFQSAGQFGGSRPLYAPPADAAAALPAALAPANSNCCPSPAVGVVLVVVPP